MKNRIFNLLFSTLIPLFSLSQNSPVSLTDTTSGCIPFNVNFQNPNPNAISFSWDFGDGNQSILENPSNTYIQAGLKTIQLILGFNNAPNDTIVLTDYIEVIVSPTANFSLNNLGTSCENQNIYEFENLSTNSTSSYWDFGDGSTSSSLNPNHTYSSSGTYPVTLVANNGNCVSTSTYSSIIIEENPSVTANSSSLFSCDSTNQYNFTAASSINQPNLLWQWNFGDGNLSNSINTSHIYNASGTFDPFVVATNASSCSDTFFLNTIENWISPVSTISAQNYSGCEPFSTQFSIQSNGTISNVDWDFGVGSIINSIYDTISYTYSLNGIHNVSTLVTFSNGCNAQVDLLQPITINPAPIANYSFSDSSGCAPLTVQFQSSTNQGNSVVWNFGDGDSSLVSQGSPSHTYLTNGLFFPQLTVTDPIGCSSTYTLDTINSGGFVADFSCSVLTGCTPLTVDFTPTNSGATSWFWDFGDGNTSNLAHPTHVYTNTGIFDVELTITNASGCIDTINYSSLIESYTETINLPQSDSIFTCSPFTFNPNVQNLALTNYQWDFGDGTTASGTNPSHEYQNSGLYTVELAATTPNGCLAQIDEFAVVTVNGLEIDLDVSLTSCDSSIFSAINNSTGNISNQWIIGEDTLLSASISQQLNQSTLIQYTSTSSIGCEVSQYIPIVFSCDSTSSDTIVFTPPMDTLPIDPNNPGGIITYPVVNFTCGPELVNLTSPFSNASSYFWDFGDGFTSAQQNPSHLYNSSGSFHLTHHALMPNGNTQILIIDYFINQHVPQVDFNYTENLLCDSAEVTFSSTAQSATSWNWNFGNGNSLNSPNAVFSFPIDNLAKTVSLTISDINNCTATETKFLAYYEPIVEVQQDTIICFGDTLEINAQ
ncbi:MAG: PKD domain-containing protein, partial [Bacteroidota bacterium]|nr:PKD domain-containing protein [Bacteroidota bacterium]